VEQYEPAILAVEERETSTARRGARISLLLKALIYMAPRGRFVFARARRHRFRPKFGTVGARNKHQVAILIAARFPELSGQLPPRRKAWMSEDERMAIFDATLIGLWGCCPNRRELM
jgi:hypothetical protein